MVLLMSVDPGFPGQTFITNTINKIKAARRMIDESGFNVDLAVDGGIKKENAPLIAKAGANVLIVGTGVFGKKVLKKAIEDIRKSCESEYTH